MFFDNTVIRFDMEHNPYDTNLWKFAQKSSINVDK